jgi:hypothetical protein
MNAKNKQHEINKYKEFLNPGGVLIDINNDQYLKLEED